MDSSNSTRSLSQRKAHISTNTNSVLAIGGHWTSPSRLVSSHDYFSFPRVLTSSSVDDGFGNRNNLLVVEAPRKDSAVSQIDDAPESTKPHNADVKPFAAVPTILEPFNARDQPDVDDESPADEAADFSDAEDHMPPLFRHESLGQVVDDQGVDDQDDEPTHYHDNEHIEDIMDENDHGAPLFRHETIAQPSHEAPLFRHESSLMDNYHADVDEMSPRTGRRSNTSKAAPDARTSPSPNVHKFPTDPVMIVDHIRRSTMRLPRDETAVEGTPPSPSLASARSSSERSLDRSVSSAGQLGMINEAEEEMSHTNDGDAEPAHPNRYHGHKHDLSQFGPIELLTPPMTPEMVVEIVKDGKFEPFVARNATADGREYQSEDTSIQNKVDAHQPHILRQTRKEQGPLAAFFFSITSWFTSVLGSPSKVRYVVQTRTDFATQLTMSIVVSLPLPSVLQLPSGSFAISGRRSRSRWHDPD